MLRTRAIFHKVNSVADFLAVKHDVRLLKEIKVQNESLCLYAILNRGVFAPHPWTLIKDSAKTPAIVLATAITAPQELVSSLKRTGNFVPEVTIAAMITKDISVWDTLPSVYKTPEIRRLYSDLITKNTSKYYWGLGSIAV